MTKEEEKKKEDTGASPNPKHHNGELTYLQDFSF